ncbi:MAG: hypothetical protein AVO39_02960 [delta proteobacterium MLS_D]|nr:MAG: hypothetical protein AVO39_02960 [delta proteobacterium MLS_D]
MKNELDIYRKKMILSTTILNPWGVKLVFSGSSSHEGRLYTPDHRECQDYFQKKLCPANTGLPAW